MKLRKLAIFIIAVGLVVATMTACVEEKETGASVIEPAGSESEGTKEAENAEPSSEEARVITAEDYSGGIDDNGFVTGFTASEFFEVPEDWSEYALLRSAVEPDQSVIDSAVSSIMSKFPIQITDRAVEDGDVVNMDYEGKLDGVAFAGGAAQGATLTAGSAEFVDNFLTKIIGHMPGETFDIEITFPDPYQNNPNLAGKLTIFTVTINFISGGSNEFTDDFVRENLDEFREAVGDDTVETTEDIRKIIYDYYYSQKQETAIYERFYALEGDVPEALYDYIYRMTDISVFGTYGIGVEELAAMSNMTEEDLREHIEKDCRPELVFQAIAEKEGWTVTDEEIEEKLGQDNVASIVERYGRNYIAHYLLTERALEYLKEHLPVTEDVQTEESASEGAN